MAFAALRSSGIEGEGLLVDRGDGSVFALLGFCLGGEYRHLPMAVRFRVCGQLRPAGAGLCGRSRNLGEPQSGICLYGLGLLSLAGPCCSILAKECCVTQYGACAGAGEHRVSHQPLSPMDLKAEFRSASLTRNRHSTAVRNNLLLRPNCTAQPPVFQSERRSTAHGSRPPCAPGEVRLVQALADRTQEPPMRKRLPPEHRDIPRCPPAIRRSPCDSGQSLTTGWHLSSGNVRSEPNRRDPVSSECARMPQLYSAVLCASSLVPAAEPQRFIEARVAQLAWATSRGASRSGPGHSVGQDRMITLGSTRSWAMTQPSHDAAYP